MGTPTIWIGTKPIGITSSGGLPIDAVHKHLYLIYDPDGDPTTGDEEVFRGGPITGTDDIAIQNWKPMGSSADPLNGDDPFADRDFTALNTNGMSASDFKAAISTWAEGLFHATDTAGNLLTYIPYTVPDEYHQTWDAPALNSNTIIANALASQGIDVHDVLPYHGGNLLGDQYDPRQFPGDESTIVQGGGTTAINSNQNNYVFNTGGGANNYVVDYNPLHPPGETTTIFEDGSSTTSDTITVNNVNTTDVRLQRGWDNSLHIYLPGDAEGDPSIIVPGQFAPGGAPQINTIWLYPPFDPDVDPPPSPIPLDPTSPDIPYPPNVPIPEIPDFIRDWYDSLGFHGSPLVMDISGNGIALSEMGGTGSVYWDINSEGMRHETGWTAAGTGLLAIDLNANGTIDDNSELFGNQPTSGIANGFQALAVYDSNSDGVINASDSQFGDLLVWVDENADGVSQATELHTLSDLNITSINLSYSNVSYQINGNDIKQESTFVIDGNTRTIADAWFQFDSMNTIVNGMYEPDPLLSYLPDQRGYGLLPSLSIAMGQNTDLKDLVADLGMHTARDMFSEAYDLRSKLQAILYEWAGVTGNATDRTGFIEFTTDDTRRVDFLEAMMGETVNGGINQEWFGRDWDMAVGLIGGNLLLQTSLNDLFGHPVYNAATDTWSGGTLGTDPTLFRFMPLYHYSDNLHDTGFNDVYVLTPGVTADGGFVIMEPNSQGTDTLLLGGVDPGDVKIWTGSYGDLVVQYTDDDQVTISGSTDGLGRTTTGDQVEHILFDDGTLWDLTQGLVLVNDDTGRYLVGSTGNDTIAGGAGNDHLRGYEGNDTYIFNTGGGTDVIDNELGGTDKIIFGAGIGPEDVVIGHYNMYDMTLTYGSGDVVTVTNFMYSADNRVESVQFTDDSTVWDVNYLLSHAQTVYGTSSNDSLSTFNSLATTFIGGAGDDSINGGGAINTTYMFGAAYGGGNDTISDGGGTDTIVIDGSPSGVTYSHSGAYDLQIGYSGGTITVSSYFYASDYKIESVSFTDVGNTVHDSTYINAQAHIINGTSSGETLSAFDNAATTFIGGAGNDTLNGHGGNDVYKFAEGDGADIINEGYASTDKIVFDAGVSVSSVTYQHTGAYDLTIHYGTSGDTVTVGYFFYNSDYKIESVEFSDVGNTVHDSSYINAQVHIMHGTSGSDSIYAFDSQDTTFYGNDGADYLQGSGGNDTFFGGDGTDLMVGSSGADTFVFEAATAFNNVDTVYDFNTTQNDVLDLRDVLGGYDPMTDTLSDFVQLTTSGGSTHVFVDRDGTGSTYSSAEIVTLYGVTSLPSVDTLVTDGHLLAA